MCWGYANTPRSAAWINGQCCRGRANTPWSAALDGWAVLPRPCKQARHCCLELMDQVAEAVQARQVCHLECMCVSE